MPKQNSGSGHQPQKTAGAAKKSEVKRSVVPEVPWAAVNKQMPQAQKKVEKKK